MKVRDKRASKISINELDEGNVFELDGNFWIKADDTYEDGILCVELTCGRVAKLNGNMPVVPCLDAEMVVRG